MSTACPLMTTGIEACYWAEPFYDRKIHAFIKHTLGCDDHHDVQYQSSCTKHKDNTSRAPRAAELLKTVGS